MKLIFTTILLASICSVAQAAIIDYSELNSGDLKEVEDSSNTFELADAGVHHWSGTASVTGVPNEFPTSDQDAFYFNLLNDIQIYRIDFFTDAIDYSFGVGLTVVTGFSSPTKPNFQYLDEPQDGAFTRMFASGLSDTSDPYNVFIGWRSVTNIADGDTLEWDWDVKIYTRDVASVPEPTTLFLMILGLLVFGVSRSKVKVADTINLPNTTSAKA